MKTAKAFVYIATSLDGFIARENGALDWLPGSDGEIEAGSGNEDFGYNSFYASIDTLVMGRKSFEKVLEFEDWPYKDKRVVVLSSKGINVPKELAGSVEALSLAPEELINYLSDSGAKKLYIDGGNTIQRFLKAGLIDEMTITTVPVLLGQGISLFGNLSGDVNCELLESSSFSNGMVQSRYRVIQSD
jgi:dihydrofolate reductase